jgi:hypothetical protein
MGAPLQGILEEIAMRHVCLLLCTGLALLGLTPSLVAQDPPGYDKHIKPIFTRCCVECHNTKRPRGGLDLESFEGLMKSGKKKTFVSPGEPDKSHIVLMVEGKLRHPKLSDKGKQPKADEVSLLRAWIAAGAKADQKECRHASPDTKLPVAQGGSVAVVDERKGPVTAPEEALGSPALPS